MEYSRLTSPAARCFRNVNRYPLFNHREGRAHGSILADQRVSAADIFRPKLVYLVFSKLGELFRALRLHVLSSKIVAVKKSAHTETKYIV